MAIACLLLSLVAISAARPSAGQLPPPGTSLTLEQYVGLQERVDAFCLYMDTQMKLERGLPEGDLTIPGVGNGQYVYTADEVKALITHCELLMRLMQRVVDAARPQR
jgi:hypothetical protein